MNECSKDSPADRRGPRGQALAALSVAVMTCGLYTVRYRVWCWQRGVC
jgi:hypothetical protein